MGAGLSQAAFDARVRRRLLRMQRELAAVGINTEYSKYQLVYQEPEDGRVSGGFNISYRRINASNGECAGLPSVYISAFGIESRRYDHLEFERGMKRVREIFSPLPEPDDTVTHTDATGYDQQGPIPRKEVN